MSTATAESSIKSFGTPPPMKIAVLSLCESLGNDDVHKPFLH
jgi:hypothetical protein